jgi:hypothetical protein
MGGKHLNGSLAVIAFCLTTVLDNSPAAALSVSDCIAKPTRFQCNECCTEVAISLVPPWAAWWIVDNLIATAQDVQNKCQDTCSLAEENRKTQERIRKLLEELKRPE